MRMAECCIRNKRYTYVHERKWASEAADVHHIVVRKSCAKGFLLYLSPLLLLANAFHLFLVKDKSITITFWTFLLNVFLVKLLLQKPVEKESVIVMPAFGVQLEAHYARILKPALLECVTPVTC